jgi:hypothetical protein
LFTQIVVWIQKIKKCDVMEQGLIGLVFCYCQQRIAPLQETHPKETEKLNVLGQVGIV